MTKKSKPRYKKRSTKDSNYVLTRGAGFHVTEAYKATRTNIMFSLPNTAGNTVCVTSPYASEGKSTMT